MLINYLYRGDWSEYLCPRCKRDDVHANMHFTVSLLSMCPFMQQLNTDQHDIAEQGLLTTRRSHDLWLSVSFLASSV